MNGEKSRAQGKENQQLLTLSEEQALAAWISRSTVTGNPVRHTFIHEIAEKLCIPRVMTNVNFVSPIGES